MNSRMPNENAYPELALLIGGERRTVRESLPVFNPSTEKEIGRVPVATAHDLEDAVVAAAQGFEAWKRVAPERRCDILMDAARLIRTRVDSIAPVLTLEQGKTLAEAKAEILRACDIIDWDAQEGRRIYGRVIPSAPGVRLTVIRQPVGVVVAFSPWNFPFGSPCRKLSGALAAGCAIVLKPSEETPASAHLLAQAFLDAGVPPKAISIVTGVPDQIATALIGHAQVRLVAFTGSVPVGKRIASLAAQAMKPALLELGGHGPAIIFGDVDPVETAKAAVAVKTRSGGQICTNPTRFIIHRDIAEAFTQAFAEAAGKVVLGDGFSQGVQMGPLVNGRRVEAMQEMVDDGLARGGRLVCGGKRVDSAGHFYPVTLLADLPDEAKAMCEEPFGPLALVETFDNLEQAIGRANRLSYGLGAYVFAKSASVIQRVVDAMECGNLSVNHFGGTVPQTPLGGVKDSGYGREGGTEGLTHYTLVKCISEQY